MDMSIRGDSINSSTTVRPSESTEALVGRMTKRGVKSIVVTDLKGKLIGTFLPEDGEKAINEAQ